MAITIASTPEVQRKTGLWEALQSSQTVSEFERTEVQSEGLDAPIKGALEELYRDASQQPPPSRRGARASRAGMSTAIAQMSFWSRPWRGSAATALALAV